MVRRGILVTCSQKTNHLFEPAVDADDESGADGKSNQDAQITMSIS